MASSARGGSKSTPKKEGKPQGGDSEQKPRHHDSGWRSWAEALVFAFVLAMFVRTFIFELFKIPTGSMIPTLIGGIVAEPDVNQDGINDLVVYKSQYSTEVFVFLKSGEGWQPMGEQAFPPGVLQEWAEIGKLHTQHDRIFVNKFAYWFSLPKRGDIVVFKVPPIIWDPAKPMYIKRAVGLPGDVLSFSDEGRIVWEEMKEDSEVPEFFKEHSYVDIIHEGTDGFSEWPYVEYERPAPGLRKIERVHVPEDGMYVLGDNTHSSLDSRYWGAFETNRLKGKAFFKYWPLRQAKFIR